MTTIQIQKDDVFKIRKRLRLYGKPTSKIEIAQEVAKLLLGDSKRYIEPLNISNVAKKLGFNSRTTIYFYLELAKTQGFIELDENQKPILPKIEKVFNWKQYSEKYPILNDPMLKVWYEKKKLKKNGKLKVLAPMLSRLTAICNTCKITPTELIQSKESAEKFKLAYLTAYQNGTDWKPIKARKKKGNLTILDYTTSYAIASFGGVHGIAWEKGTSEMSRKIVGHGNFSDIRLTKEELVKADTWIKENYGLDSDLFRFFWFGVETCARKEAMRNCKLEWTIHKSNSGKTTFIMSVIETKTIHIKNGKWTKYIRNLELQESLMRLKERGGTRLYENADWSITKFIPYISKQLIELWKFLGKEGYFINHPIHVLRHLGAHYLLSMGNYANHSIVAVLGGWNIVDELIKSYGEIPPEVILQELDKFDN